MTEPILLFGIPFDFVLFAATLLGIALFHRHTLLIALGGLVAITAYKLSITGFKDGAGLAGLFIPFEPRILATFQPVPAFDGVCAVIPSF